jgi:hypothetical protein
MTGRLAWLVSVALAAATVSARADAPGTATRGSTLLSACLIVGGGSMAVVDASQTLRDGSYTLGAAGVLIGVSGYYYTSQVDHVRDATAIRITGTLALVSGVAAILRRANVLKVPPRTSAPPHVYITSAGARGGPGLALWLSW